MNATPRSVVALAARGLVTLLFVTTAHAGLLEDDDARKAILELRQKVDQNAELNRTQQADLAEQINQLKRGLLDLNNQLEQMRGDLQRMTGQYEDLFARLLQGERP